MDIIGIHPYTDKYPMLDETELAELAESIATNGLRQPIVITQDGQVLDGRNRLAACERAEVEPDVEVYDGDDLAEYVIDCNSARRHMSTGARAMSTALVLAEDGRRSNGRWTRGAVPADTSGSGSSSQWAQRVAEAGVVLDQAPELADQVVNGDMALDAAYKQATDRRDAKAEEVAKQQEEERKEAEAQEFITENAPDLADQVGDGGPFQTYLEAYAIWEQRNREEAERLAKEKAEAEKRQREIEKGWKDTCWAIAECSRRLDGGKAYGESFLKEFYPHEAEYLPDGMRLSRERIDSNIEFLQTIREGVTKR